MIYKTKIILIILGIIITGGLIWAANFYNQNLRGVGPAIKKPPADIVEIIEEHSVEPPAAENRTAFPLALPDGLTILIFAKGFDKPRDLVADLVGRVLVSDTNAGTVLALQAGDKIIVAQNLNKPHGLALHCNEDCQLYIAEENQVAVYNYNLDSAQATNKQKIIDLPTGGRHFTRSLLLTPDNKLLISIGSACDSCHEPDDRRGTILQANLDGSNLEKFATGLRNAVFMALHPETQKIWVTEMGRDFLGDDLPPDEINIVKKNGHYGWPGCYGKNKLDGVIDPDIRFIRAPCSEPFELPSYIDIPAHSAPLGLAFIPPTESWPEKWHHDLLVAFHGSWNRSVPTGYKIVRYPLDARGNFEGAPDSFEDFISGWLVGGDSLGRPVDILIEDNGKMYISDDKAGVVYLVEYKKSK
jgi:glucose/arabinose dehydrogenase